MELAKKAGGVIMSVPRWLLKKIPKTKHHMPPPEASAAANHEIPITTEMDDYYTALDILLQTTPEDVPNIGGSFMNIDTHVTTPGESAAPPPHPMSVVYLERDDQLPLSSSIVHRAIDLSTAINTFTAATNTRISPPPADPAAAVVSLERDDDQLPLPSSIVHRAIDLPTAINTYAPAATNTGISPAAAAEPAASVVSTNSLKSLITMIREAEIGKVCILVDASAIIAWIVVQANGNKVKGGLDWVLVGLIISFQSIVVGIAMRKYIPLPAKVTEQFGICLAIISLVTFASLYVHSKVVLVLVVTPCVFVVFVLAAPILWPVLLMMRSKFMTISETDELVIKEFKGE